MDGFLRRPREEQAALFEMASAEMNLAADAVEKGFWVCWALREVFGLRGGLSPYVGNELLPGLRASCLPLIESGRIKNVDLDPDAEDGQAILIEYAPVLGSAGYVRPSVKLELGARSDVEPNELAHVQPFVARLCKARPGLISTATCESSPQSERSGRRSGGPRPRLARHYYDIWCLEQRGIADRAMATSGLFERVVEHRRTYFPPRSEASKTLQRGSIRLIPDELGMKEWRDDFEKTRESMFFGEAPKFTQIIDGLRGLEHRINTGDE